MKKAKAVIDAEAAVQAKAAEISVAKDALKRLEGELADARAAVRLAQAEADASLSACRIVTVGWRSLLERDNVSAVIVRGTPSGMLVVRRRGDPIANEYKFKWSAHSGKYRRVEKSSFYASDFQELRDVPASYLPSPQPEGSQP